MARGRPKDYHDYVFKDGRLVGAFEEMYRYSEDIPWHQDQTAFMVFSDIDIAILRHERYDSILDVGCGQGFFTVRLQKELKNTAGAPPAITALDISPTAIEKAGKTFGGIDFRVADISKEALNERFELVIVKEVMWYVFERLDSVMRNIRNMLKPAGWVYVSQAFPETKDYIGKDFINSPSHLKEILAREFHLRHYCVEHDPAHSNRPYVHILLRER